MSGCSTVEGIKRDINVLVGNVNNNNEGGYNARSEEPNITDNGGQDHNSQNGSLLKESSEVKDVLGITTFQINMKYEKTYDALLNFFKRRGENIESASKEIGQIVTAISITGGWQQTGTKSQVTLIKDNNKSTTLRIVVSEQKRYKALQTEPWDDPIVNVEKSSNLTRDLKKYLDDLIKKAVSPVSVPKINSAPGISHVIDPKSTIKTILEEQPPTYAYIATDIEVTDKAIKMTIPASGSILTMGIPIPGTTERKILYYRHLGKPILSKSQQDPIWNIQIVDKQGNDFYWVYTTTEGEAELFVTALNYMINNHK